MAPDREEKDYVRVARLSTVGLIILSSFVALQLENAMQAFQILLQIGAGTGLVFLLRWFWWRVNTWSEISAMVISFLVALYFAFVHTRLGFEAWEPSTTLVLGVAITTVGWLSVTFMTPPVDADTLRAFHRSIRPLGRGWEAIVGDGKSADEAPSGDGGRARRRPPLVVPGVHHGVRSLVRNRLPALRPACARRRGTRRGGRSRLGSLQDPPAGGFPHVVTIPEVVPSKIVPYRHGRILSLTIVRDPRPAVERT